MNFSAAIPLYFKKTKATKGATPKTQAQLTSSKGSLSLNRKWITTAVAQPNNEKTHCLRDSPKNMDSLYARISLLILTSKWNHLFFNSYICYFKIFCYTDKKRYYKARKEDMRWQIKRAKEKGINMEDVYFDSHGDMRYSDTHEIVE